MNIDTTIREAIAQSVRQTEIVHIDADATREAVLEAAGEVDEDYDSATENDGALDIWGVIAGSEWRIRVKCLP